MKTLNPRIVIPMHYRDKNCGFDKISTVLEFLKAMDGGLVLNASEIDLREHFENQIPVLTPHNAE